MSWGELPVLPLCRIYMYLSNEDSLVASACCKNWRYAIQFHRLSRDRLGLKINNDFFEKNAFLCEMFARNVKNLDLVLASSVDEYSKSITTTLCRFLESKQLISVSLIPTSEYIIFENTHNKSFLARTFFPFLYKMCQLPSLKILNLHGCSELIVHASILLETISQKQQIETLGFGGLRPISEIPPFNFHSLNQFTSLQSLSIEYSWLDNNILCDLKNQLPYLRNLVINITSVPNGGFLNLSSAWAHLKSQGCFLEVTINCISLPPESLVDINRQVLAVDMPLKALRMLFCKSINMDILRRLCHYNIFLKELIWVDSVINRNTKAGSVVDVRPRNSRRTTRQQTPNPLVMMCWQCSALENITLHGYWHLAHDLLGMARLRGDSLNHLDISMLLPFAPPIKKQQPFSPARLSYEDLNLTENYIPDGFVQKMRDSLGFHWMPPVWNDLHPSLLSDSNESISSKQDYIIELIKNDLKTN